ncbi:DDHD family phospholipase [Aspergillus brunneoviolaceus CBS 621.78]|uniref:DDHD-domain-containing protein n=1 Tax=Aspergillus brunneoviolaceus CBS 621.78 TaxID=1450534 RepID=A0ACD1GJS1_9EURO|nr:DDHD-domain-containing protein [Aspergillus brunneoviolaceus CBS 621.78]RAH49513.1 DDHD-domain-containing protein [Aspergillus brunneoviolaceus CBS 621.78]
MPKESQRGPFLGAISPWSSPQSSTPLSTTDKQHDIQNILKQSQGQDHAVTHRYRLSLHRYPEDCPPLSVKWFYAVDSPKRKPELSTSARNKEDLKLPPPKKFVQFSIRDSHAIEEAFQRISDIEVENENFSHEQADPGCSRFPTKVSVNEDFLFDVNVENRELAPTYWVGPIYEVRRGTWFFQEGSTMKPCEENLATQLEEGYLKLKPWRCSDTGRSPSTASSTTLSHQDSSPRGTSGTSNEPRDYRLFGAYMSNIVTYQDASTALLTSDDFMSRVSTTVYQKLGAVAGTKLIRGFNEAKKPTDSSKCGTPPKQTHDGLKRRTKLPGQLEVESKLLGLTELTGPDNPSLTNTTTGSATKEPCNGADGRSELAELEEQVRTQDQKEMEASKDPNEDRDREIDHLVLVTHGIGQRLGLRLESVNFIHDVNVLRKTMKSVYRASPDLQAFNSQFADKHENCRIQVLPVCWRHMLDFPYQRMEQSRKELDLADAEAPEDAIPAYPTLSDITLDNVPAVRNLISDLAMDVLLYQSAYCEQISHIVKGECNRILRLFKERNPSFKGSVSLCGHSLGSAILFDILCHEPHDSHHATPSVNARQPQCCRDSSLEFQCQEFFCLGSPVALFQMLKGKTIAARRVRDEGLAEVPSFPENYALETPLQPTPQTKSFASHQTSTVVAQNELSVSSPKCGQLYNIFHPSDPVSYRLEPLISPALSSLKPQPLPSVKKSLWATSGQSLSMIGSRVGQSVGSLWTNFTSGVASSLLNRSLGLSPEDASTRSSSNANTQDPQNLPSVTGASALSEDKSRRPTLLHSDLETLYGKIHRDRISAKQNLQAREHASGAPGADSGSKRILLEDAKVRALNANGRVDYSIQEGAFDISMIASIASHLSYWTDEDVSHFMLSQMLCRREQSSGSQDRP